MNFGDIHLTKRALLLIFCRKYWLNTILIPFVSRSMIYIFKWFIQFVIEKILRSTYIQFASTKWLSSIIFIFIIWIWISILRLIYTHLISNWWETSASKAFFSIDILFRNPNYTFDAVWFWNLIINLINIIPISLLSSYVFLFKHIFDTNLCRWTIFEFIIELLSLMNTFFCFCYKLLNLFLLFFFIFLLLFEVTFNHFVKSLLYSLCISWHCLGWVWVISLWLDKWVFHFTVKILHLTCKCFFIICFQKLMGHPYVVWILYFVSLSYLQLCNQF